VEGLVHFLRHVVVVGLIFRTSAQILLALRMELHVQLVRIVEQFLINVLQSLVVIPLSVRILRLAQTISVVPARFRLVIRVPVLIFAAVGVVLQGNVVLEGVDLAVVILNVVVKNARATNVQAVVSMVNRLFVR
jgi:hypothetical protein